MKALWTNVKKSQVVLDLDFRDFNNLDYVCCCGWGLNHLPNSVLERTMCELSIIEWRQKTPSCVGDCSSTYQVGVFCGRYLASPFQPLHCYLPGHVQGCLEVAPTVLLCLKLKGLFYLGASREQKEGQTAVVCCESHERSYHVGGA